MSLQIEKNNSSLHYVQLGILRSVVGHFFEHPFDVHKVKAQSFPSYTHREVILKIYRTRGVIGWADGFIPNLQKRAFKEALRWPMINTAYQFWKKVMGPGFAPKVATGLSIAAFETLLLPFDRFMVAKVSESGYGVFYEKHLRNRSLASALRSLYGGANVVVANRISAWSAFIFSDHAAKKICHKMDPSQKHPLSNKLFTTSITALGLSLSALPFDFMKTQIQLDKTDSLRAMSFIKLTRQLAGQYGIRRFYAGMGFDVGHRFIHVYLTSLLFDKVTSSNSK